VVAALALYGVWVLTTYLLEGLPQTLLRPEAQGLRLAYTGVANLMIGTLGSLILLRRLILTGSVTALAAGFGSHRRSALGALLGAVLGVAFLAAQDAPGTSLIVMTNVFAQALPVSVAEVLVCWSLVGAGVGSSIGLRVSRVTQAIAVSVVASVTFGVYHAAHSAPFNTLSMIAMLTAVGVVTSAVFVLLRDVYGTIAFHNCLAVYGVLGTLVETGKVSRYAGLSAPLLITALASLEILIVARTLLLRDGAPRRPTTGVP
jgi:hypothetical protein